MCLTSGRIPEISKSIRPSLWAQSYPKASFNLLLFSRFTICHKTEVVKNTLNPVWQPFSIPVRALCNGDYDRSASAYARE